MAIPTTSLQTSVSLTLCAKGFPLSLVGHPPGDGVLMKTLYMVDVL